MMRIRPLFSWSEVWVGVHVDRGRRRVCWRPLPFVGLLVEFPRQPASVNCTAKAEGLEFYEAMRRAAIHVRREQSRTIQAGEILRQQREKRMTIVGIELDLYRTPAEAAEITWNQSRHCAVRVAFRGMSWTFPQGTPLACIFDEMSRRAAEMPSPLETPRAGRLTESLPRRPLRLEEFPIEAVRYFGEAFASEQGPALRIEASSRVEADGRATEYRLEATCGEL